MAAMRTTMAADLCERLRALGKHIHRLDSCSPEAAMMYEAADEIGRLRGALQRIVNEADSDDGMTAWDGGDIAREALAHLL